MAYTDSCDLFGALHEDAMNRVVRHVMQQRPSMFNYATNWFKANMNQLCAKIDAHPAVTTYSDPMFSVEALLPVPGTSGAYGLDYCVQLTDAEIDFHPNNVIALAPELSPLGAQRFALRAKACVGIACPDKEILDQMKPVDDPKDQVPTRPIPFKDINCFCLEVQAVCHVEMTDDSGVDVVSLHLDGLEIVNIKPDGLENAIECYVATILRLAVLPKLQIALDFLTFNLTTPPMGLSLKPTPISAAVPFNPSIADDQLSVFLDLEVS
ncbi:hypothetical protein ACFL12_02160 [Pseudomonadota bacterium]